MAAFLGSRRLNLKQMAGIDNFQPVAVVEV